MIKTLKMIESIKSREVMECGLFLGSLLQAVLRGLLRIFADLGSAINVKSGHF